MTSKTIVAVFGIPATVCSARVVSCPPLRQRRDRGDRRRRGRRRADARHADDPASTRRAGGKAARSDGPAGAPRQRRSRRRSATGRTGASTRCSGSGSSTRAPRRRRNEDDRPIVQYYRGLALLWAGYPADASQALESAKKFGRNTIIQSRADNFLHPNFFQDPHGAGLPGVRPGREQRPARAGLGAAGGGAPGVGRGRVPAGRPRRTRTTPRRRWRSAVGALRRGQPDARLLAPRAADRALPEEPDRPLLPRAAARLDRPGARLRSSSSRTR